MNNALLAIDGYKIDHIRQYPKNTTLIFSNFTARKSRRGLEKTVFFGLQYYISKHLIEGFGKFFLAEKKDAVNNYKKIINNYLGINVDASHIDALHDLQYLPIEIWALPEGSLVNVGVPSLVMFNTHPDFAWLVNYLETSLSATVWGMCTSATTAHEYRKILDKYAGKTSDNIGDVNYQAHDFSFRGMFNIDAAAMSAAGHLLSFDGTDCVAAIDFISDYYKDKSDRSCNACSVPATEHSVMSAGGKFTELETFSRLIGDVYPSGIVSIVSDTWDFWNVITNYTKSLKELILSRDGKVVFRPDSGDPVKIICGDSQSKTEHEKKGAVEVLWDIFGGNVNSKGYKQLDSHVGLIYGDSITIERAEEICCHLMKKGFASTNIIFGIGSYTYQYVTRDTDGYAMKATFAIIDKEGREIFKDPVTDDGTKKSAKGLLAVYKSDDGYSLKEMATIEDVKNCAFKRVFINSAGLSESFIEIKERLKSESFTELLDEE